MRDMGLRGAIRGKPLRTTISDKAAPCPLDRVNRQFHASAPDRLWLADFTYRRPGPASSMSPLSSTPTPGGSSAGGPAGRRTPTRSWTPSNRRSMTEGLPAPAASSIIVITQAPKADSSGRRNTVFVG